MYSTSDCCIHHKIVISILTRPLRLWQVSWMKRGQYDVLTVKNTTYTDDPRFRPVFLPENRVRSKSHSPLLWPHDPIQQQYLLSFPWRWRLLEKRDRGIVHFEIPRALRLLLEKKTRPNRVEVKWIEWRKKETRHSRNEKRRSRENSNKMEEKRRNVAITCSISRLISMRRDICTLSNPLKLQTIIDGTNQTQKEITVRAPNFEPRKWSDLSCLFSSPVLH